MERQLMKRLSYRIIPPPAEKEFEKYMTWWYESEAEPPNMVPVIHNGMIYETDSGVELFNDFLSFVHDWYYARDREDISSDLNEFPIMMDWTDDQIDEATDHYIDTGDELEEKLYADMMLYLNVNKQFYADAYTRELFPDPAFNLKTYHHVPIRRVW